MENKISFSFAKKSFRNQIVTSEKLKESEETRDDDHKVTEFDQSLKLNEKVKKELVIPLISKNKWQIPDEKAGSSVNKIGNTSLEDAAAKEILQEIQKKEEEKGEGDAVIPLLLQNKLPDGFETDDKLDVSLRGKEPSLEDYDAIPVEEYGMAMLRGMGWKAGEGVGPRGKIAPETITPVLRPQGLGLGADRKMNSQVQKAKEGVVEKMEKGSYVCIEGGSHKGQYGQVQELSDDLGRISVQLTLNKEMVYISEVLLQVISKEQFKRDSKVINKQKYDDYKRAQEMEAKEQSKNSKKDDSGSESSRKKHKKKHHRDSERKEKRNRREEKSYSRSSRDEKPKMWVRSDLIVRLINKDYKKGRYYKSKVVIEDVSGIDNCMCRTEDGSILLENIPQDYLETVIPKNDPARVMIVLGPHAGKRGEIIERSRDKCEAVVQILPDRDELVTVSFDNICDYVKSY